MMETSFLKVRNTRTGLIDHQIPVAGPAEISAAAARCRAAQVDWQQIGPAERASRLSRLADCMLAHRAGIAAAVEADTGRRRIAGIEVDAVIGTVRGWAAFQGVPEKTDWTQGRSNPAIRHRGQYVPYGLIGVISPWNYPLLLSLIDAIPALLAGCSVMIKPSEVTPRFVRPFQVALDEAGFGDLVAIVTGGGSTGSNLIDVVDLVCFTGSVATGRKVAMQAAGRLIPAFLELGGKDPMIVLAGADLDLATDAALRGSVLGTGQACQSIERIYVDRSIHEEFVDLLAAKARQIRFNDEDIGRGDLGPIIYQNQADILTQHIADAVARGAKLVCGGRIHLSGGGLWLGPTLLTDVTQDMQVMREETFGPVMPVMAFDTVEEAIALANDTEFGLSAAVFAADLDQAEEVALELEAGAISLNDAALTSLFHEAEKQAFKSSGLGPSRMGAAGLTRFVRRKALIANTGRPLTMSQFAEDSE